MPVSALKTTGEDPQHTKEIISKDSEVHMYILALLPRKSAIGAEKAPCAGSQGHVLEKEGFGGVGRGQRGEGRLFLIPEGKYGQHINYTLNTCKNTVRSES